MALDLTGGLDVRREYGFEHYPDTPGMRNSVNFWMCADNGEFAMPRCTMEAVGPDWRNKRNALVNIAFPDGRVFTLRAYDCKGPASNRGPDGKPTIFGAGPYEFRLIEPFKEWEVSFKGPCVATTTQAQAEGQKPGTGDPVDVEFHIKLSMVVPPWAPGSFLEEGLRGILTETELGFTSNHAESERHEQLFRGKGTLRIGGEERSFTGSGLRIRRQNIFKVTEFLGHCWQSGVFPSGRGFGANNYMTNNDGKPSYSEAFLFDDGEMIPARVVRVPWLTKIEPMGDDVSLILETRKGFHHIKGTTIASTFEVQPSADIPNFPALQQASVRYELDGEVTYGMMERSTPHRKLGIGPQPLGPAPQ